MFKDCKWPVLSCNTHATYHLADEWYARIYRNVYTYSQFQSHTSEVCHPKTLANQDHISSTHDHLIDNELKTYSVYQFQQRERYRKCSNDNRILKCKNAQYPIIYTILLFHNPIQTRPHYDLELSYAYVKTRIAKTKN